jgi:glycogen(starch) synthase
MRILCVSTDYPPLGSGGYERQCRDTVDHLRARGHDVRLLTGTAPPRAGDDDVYRELPRFPVRPRPVSFGIAWRAERSTAATLSRHISAFRPDAACLWRLGELSMSLPTRIASAGIPSVGMVCDPWMLDGPRRDPYARFCPPRFGGVARWLFVSRPLRDQVVAGVDVTGSEIVPAGVDVGAFPVAQARSWRWRLLYAGRLSPLKGVDLAIRALAHTPPVATLDIVGAGNARFEDRLLRLARRLGVAARVRFHGVMPRAALARAYAIADAVVFPVRWREPFGLVPLEAMATGTPVIGVAAGGAAETLVDGRTALVVPPDDAHALAAAVRRLAADPGLRQRLRAGGRQMAERYPAARSHAAVAAALEDAAGCRGDRAPRT